jgi:hypothetical protein
MADHHPDPGIEHGNFRVLPRTDGGYVVVDGRRKPGKQTVGGKFRTLEDAAQAALTWHQQGHG